MNVVTRPELLFLARQTNSTDASLVIPVPQLTAPGYGNPDGIIPLIAGDDSGVTGLRIIPFGTTTATNTFKLIVYGWTCTVGNQQTATAQAAIWVPIKLAAFTCTLCTVPGLSGADVNASQLFCGTITQQLGNANFSSEIISPTGNEVCHCMVATKDCLFAEIRFDMNSSATSANCLVQRI